MNDTARLLLAALEASPATPAQRWREGAEWRSRSAGAVALEARRVAASLLAIGVRPGDRVGLVADSGPAFLPGNLGILAAGAADVPRGTEAPPREIARLLEHSGAVGCLCAGSEAVRRVLASGFAPRLRFVARLDAGDASDGVEGAEAFLRRGGGPAPDTALPPLAASDLAAVVYTSGTSGTPRGAALEHRAFLHQLSVLPAAMDLRREDRLLTFLPPWHAYGRIVEYAAAAAGAETVFTDRRRLREDLAAVGPTWMAAVPRVWHFLLAGARAAAAGKGAAAETATLRALLGGKLRVGISGGSRMPPDLDAVLSASGLRFFVGYGLTETGPVVALRRPDANRPGTLGPPVPGTEIRIVDAGGAVVAPGEPGILHVRGPQVMRGYLGEPELTAAVLRDGWFETGDIVRAEPDGHLVFVGRAKDTIVLAGGEKIEPGPVEDRLAASPWIEQAVAVGQDRKGLGVLLVPAKAAMERDLGARGVPAPLSPEALEAALREEVQRLLTEDAGFLPWERRPLVAILPGPLTVEDGLLTATGKVRRGEVLVRHAERIDALYGSGS